MRTLKLGTIAGLKIIVLPSAIVCFFLLWLAFALIGAFPLNFTPLESIIGGLIAAFLHFVAEFLHNFSHSVAARSTGYPMSGVAFWMILGKSLYPRDEPELAASVHIRRALGGPVGSFIFSLAAGLIVLLLAPSGGLVAVLALYFFLDNLLFFALGSLLPLRILDGGTILYWWGKR